MKAIGEKYEFTLLVSVETDQWERIRGLRKILNRYGFEVRLLVSDSINAELVKKYNRKLLLEQIILGADNFEDLRAEYHRWKGVGITVSAESYELTEEEYRQFFSEWISDEDGVWFLPFRNIFSSLLMGVSVEDCEHSSCLGKYLYVDEAGSVYFCRKKKSESVMYRIAEQQEGQLYRGSYEDTLGACIKARKECRDNCGKFNICHGGCPLNPRKNTMCTAYRNLIPELVDFIQKEIGNYFSDLKNPCLRQLYLSMIAYGYDMS
jgi:radical SAM protein with 4Fe4S-binding SPASM domain